jgi:hypothetical protein
VLSNLDRMRTTWRSWKGEGDWKRDPSAGGCVGGTDGRGLCGADEMVGGIRSSTGGHAHVATGILEWGFVEQERGWRGCVDGIVGTVLRAPFDTGLDRGSMARTEGLGALYRGPWLRIARGGPAGEFCCLLLAPRVRVPLSFPEILSITYE